jgi:hypothetical protein
MKCPATVPEIWGLFSFGRKENPHITDMPCPYRREPPLIEYSLEVEKHFIKI